MALICSWCWKSKTRHWIRKLSLFTAARMDLQLFWVELGYFCRMVPEGCALPIDRRQSATVGSASSLCAHQCVYSRKSAIALFLAVFASNQASLSMEQSRTQSKSLRSQIRSQFHRRTPLPQRSGMLNHHTNDPRALRALAMSTENARQSTANCSIVS